MQLLMLTQHRQLQRQKMAIIRYRNESHTNNVKYYNVTHKQDSNCVTLIITISGYQALSICNSSVTFYTYSYCKKVQESHNCVQCNNKL